MNKARFLRGCATTLLVTVVMLALGVWYWYLATATFFQITPTWYNIYWARYIDNLWQFTWTFWVSKDAGSVAFWCR